jgi:lysozyme
MKTSALGLSLIKESEGLKLKAYKCPAGVWTIGYGHTQGVKEGDTCTKEQAHEMLARDVRPIENELHGSGLKLNQSKFDALVSFIYNVGIGNFNNSTLVKKIWLNSNNPTIRDEFMKWNKCSGEFNKKDDDGDGLIDEKGEKQVVAGLTIRRKKEADLYFLS